MYGMKPRGRPPLDPVKRAQYDAAKNASLSAATYAPVVHLTDEQVVNEISDRFDILGKITKGTAMGAIRSCIIAGAGGVGKTYTVENILDAAKESHGITVKIVRGKITPINLYMLLYENRASNAVVVLDDADGIFAEEDGVNLLKAALDTSAVRQISWMSQSAALTGNDIPDTFQYEGSMIFISNMNFQAIIDAGKMKIAPHLQALLTRTLYLDLKLHTPRELTLWIQHSVRKYGILIQEGLSVDAQEEVLSYMKENRDKLRSLSLRTVKQLAGFVKMDPVNWRRDANVLMLR